jgi:fibronectin-binding autotransporter adhesin
MQFVQAIWAFHQFLRPNIPTMNRKISLKFASPIVGLLMVSAATAADFRWTGGTPADLSAGSNWQGGTAPSGTTATDLTIAAGDKVLMDGGGGATASNLGAGAGASTVNVSSGANLTLDGGGWGGFVDAKVNLAPGGTVQVDGNGDAKRIAHLALTGSGSTNTLITNGRFDIRDNVNTLDFGMNNTLNKTGFNGLNVAGGTQILGTGTLNLNEGYVSIEAGVNWPAGVNINATNGTNLASWAGGQSSGNSTTIAADIGLSNNAQIENRYRDDGKTFSGTITLTGTGRLVPQVSNNNGETANMDQWMNVTGKVTGTGMLQKEGAGTLVLANTGNDYTGGTNLTNGKIDSSTGVIPAGKITTAPGTEINNGAAPIQLTNGSSIQGKITGTGPVKLISGTSQLAVASPSDLPNVELAGGNLSSGLQNAIFSSNPVQVTASSKVLMTNQTLTLQIEGNNLDGSNHGAGPDVFSAFTPGVPAYANNPTQTYGFVTPGQTTISAIDGTAKPYGNFWRSSYYGKIINTGTTNIDVSFGEQFDDQARVTIDGVDALSDGAWDTATSTSNRIGQPGINGDGTISITPGSHDIVIQAYDGWGGTGPHSGWTKGIGWRLGGYAITTPNTGAASNAGTQADNAAFQKIDTLNTIHPNLKFSDNSNRTISQAFNIQAGGNLDIDNSSMYGGKTVLDGPVSGPGNLTTNGSVILAGANTFIGKLMVNTGTAELTNAAAVSTANGINVAAGATLDASALTSLNTSGPITGNGTITSNNLVANDPISPGNSIGTLSVTGNITLGAGLNIELGAGGTADLLAVSGTLTAGGPLMVTWDGGMNPMPAPYTDYNIMDFGTFAGSFASTSLPALTGTDTWDTSKLSTQGILTFIPEPSSSLLGLLGLGAVGLRRRRK